MIPKLNKMMLIIEQLEAPQHKPKDNGHSKYPTSETVNHCNLHTVYQLNLQKSALLL